MKLKYLLLMLFPFLLFSCVPDEEKKPEPTPSPDPTPEPTPDPTPEPEPIISEVVTRAIEELGKPYLWGGVGPEGYDASGLVCYCLTGSHSRFGTVNTFLNWPKTDNPIPGDICVNSNTCGIYISSNQMIYAPTYGEVVRYNEIFNDMIFVKYPN